ncbi:hypothetical protein [Massilia glaciei]|uniref:Uncharacterized protein n=1 Tax=Massilia glaciei TaxID=1524097 RepID=A0A2U2H8X3_9BURK|nr:hypothetical protein [Massilia glaciei]PWF39059.1 hypothetical protein C7C56_027765 [Massilia glaciei]
MRPASTGLLALALLLPALGGCMALAVGGAVVGVGVTAAKVAVKTGVLVGKGVYKVGDAIIGDTEAEKAAKAKAKAEQEERQRQGAGD